MKEECRLKTTYEQVQMRDLDDSGPSSSMQMPDRMSPLQSEERPYNQCKSKMKGSKTSLPACVQIAHMNEQLMQQTIMLEALSKKHLTATDTVDQDQGLSDDDKSFSCICDDVTHARMPVMENEDLERMTKKENRSAGKNKAQEVEENCRSCEVYEAAIENLELMREKYKEKVRELKQKCKNDLQKQLDDSREECVQLRVENDRLKNTIAQSNRENECKTCDKRRQQKMRTMQEQIEQLTCDKKSLVEHKLELEKQFEILEANLLREKQQEKMVMQEKTNKLEEEKNVLGEKIVELEQQFSAFKEKFHHEKEEVNEKFEKEKNDHIATILKLKPTEEQLKIAEENHRDRQQENTILQEKIYCLEAEKTSLAERIVEFEVLEETLHCERQEKTTMQEDMFNLDEERISLAEKIAELEQRVCVENGLRERQEEKMAMQENINHLEEENYSLAGEKAELEKKFESSKRRCKNRRKIEENMASRIDQLAEQDVKREADQVALRRERDAARTDADHLRTYNDMLQELVDGLQTRLQAFEDRIQDNQDLRNELLQITDGLQLFQPPPGPNINGLQDPGQLFQVDQTVIALHVETEVHVPD